MKQLLRPPFVCLFVICMFIQSLQFRSSRNHILKHLFVSKFDEKSQYIEKYEIQMA